MPVVSEIQHAHPPSGWFDEGKACRDYFGLVQNDHGTGREVAAKIAKNINSDAFGFSVVHEEMRAVARPRRCVRDEAVRVGVVVAVKDVFHGSA